VTAEKVLGQKDPIRALDAFRELDIEEKLVAVFADGAILRHESRLIEGIVIEFRRWGRRLLVVLAIALATLIGLALGNRQLGVETTRLSEQIIECTTPGTECTNRAQSGSGQACAVLLLQNDNRLVNGYDPDADGAVDTIPVPKECQP